MTAPTHTSPNMVQYELLARAIAADLEKWMDVYRNRPAFNPHDPNDFVPVVMHKAALTLRHLADLRAAPAPAPHGGDREALVATAKGIIVEGCGCHRECEQLLGPDVYCGCEKDARAILALRPASPDTGWRDIASAPSLGELILTYDPRNKEAQRIELRRADGEFWSWMKREGCATPTHWMPLPAPPTVVPSYDEKGGAA